jgi:hypothetical protein
MSDKNKNVSERISPKITPNESDNSNGIVTRKKTSALFGKSVNNIFR